MYVGPEFFKDNHYRIFNWEKALGFDLYIFCYFATTSFVDLATVWFKVSWGERARKGGRHFKYLAAEQKLYHKKQGPQIGLG